MQPNPSRVLSADPAYVPAIIRAGWAPVVLRSAQLIRLCKLRVVSLIIFTAVIGMFLAVPGLPRVRPLLFGSLGIALLAAAAAAVNCLIDREIDAKMARTRGRTLATGVVTPGQTLAFALVLGGIGLVLLYAEVNPLTMWLTLATFLGYVMIYTVLLKPLTPQTRICQSRHPESQQRRLIPASMLQRGHTGIRTAGGC
jgi:heme o synthase